MTPTDPAPPRTYRGGFLLFATATAVLLAVLVWNGVRDEFARSAAYTQVQDLLRMQEAAWNKGDLDGFMAGYRMSDEITFYSEGKVERGWVGLRERYARDYGTGGQNMGRLTFTGLSVDVLSADAVLARGQWEVEREGKTKSGLFTILVRKFPEGWRVVHDHTSKALG